MTLTLGDVHVGPSPATAGAVRLQGRVRSDVDGLDELIWLDVSERDAGALRATGDPFLCWLAPVAVTRREALRLDVPTDTVLLEQVREVLRIWCRWFPSLGHVPVDATSVAPPPATTERRTASMFTGGVDSFFTVLRHDAGEGTPRTERIDDLVFVHGFDVALANVDAARTVVASLASAAQSLGKRLVVATTNLRESCFGRTDWSRLSHGAALAGVAHALGGAYHTVLLGSSAGYGDLRYWGSHPLTDPMFFSSHLRFLHDGAAFMRAEKTEYVARSAVALRHLRVCWRSTRGDNCNQCSGCLRTMLTLEALGVLAQCATFDRSALDLDRVARVFCQHDFEVRQFGYVRDLAEREGRLDLVRAVERSLADSAVLTRRLAALERWRTRPLAWRVVPALARRLRRGRVE